MTPRQKAKYDKQYHEACASIGQTAAVVGYLRYEAVRTMRIREFADLCERNLCSEGTFDDLVDSIIADRA